MSQLAQLPLESYLLAQQAAADQGLGVALSHRRGVADLLVEKRLGEGGLVALVVAVLAIADEVDHDVVAESLAVGHREPNTMDRGLGILGVHVEDRYLDHLGDVAAVERRARLGGRGGEADLVVDDDVQRAAGRVPTQLREIQGLRHDPLAGESRIPM